MSEESPVPSAGRRRGWWIGGKERVTEEQRREQMKAIFYREFPDFTGEMPYWRNQ